MSYQMKKALVTILTEVSLLVAYGIWGIGKVNAGMGARDDLQFWAGAMLIFIGIGIAATVVIQIVFHTAFSVEMAAKNKVRNGKYDSKQVEREIKQEMVEDEMDQLVGLKSTQAAFSVAGTGFAVALVAIVLGSSHVVMLNILFVSFTLGSACEGAMQLHYYKRGVRNGR